jgi:hypothetical protein
MPAPQRKAILPEPWKMKKPAWIAGRWKGSLVEVPQLPQRAFGAVSHHHMVDHVDPHQLTCPDEVAGDADVGVEMLNLRNGS